jgi:hypothetical protein
MAQFHPGVDSYEIAPSHPVALELATDATFTERARQWCWKKYDPGLPVPPSGWPPGIRGAYGVYNYWREVILHFRAHDPYNTPDTDSLESAVELALELSARDPLLTAQNNEPVPLWITVAINGRNHFIRADRVVSWTKFAGSTYDVILDDARTGRVDDAAFEMKVAS